MEFVIIVVLMRSAVDVYRLRRETNSQGITIREPNKRLPLKHASNRPEKKNRRKKEKKKKKQNEEYSAFFDALPNVNRKSIAYVNVATW